MRTSTSGALATSNGAPPAPLRGRRCAIATMHGKERAIGPAFSKALGFHVIVPEQFDTDVFGAFSGEVARRGTALDAAINKARCGMRAAGADAGVASEGSYGAHPVFHFVPGGLELMTYIDDRLGVTVSETLIIDRTNFSHCVAAAADDLNDFLSKAGFPEHALIVRPNHPADDKEIPLVKGVIDVHALAAAIRECAGLSKDGKALIETDMRAHLNPTRMAAIATLAERLAARLASACPVCAAPGFGQVDRITGLPCEACLGESTLVRRLVFGCVRCDYREERPRPDGLTAASPTYCLTCNP